MTRSFSMIIACGAMAVMPVAPLAAQTPTTDVASLVAQQWVPATQVEQQEARGGAKRTLPPKIKAIVKRVLCKKRSVGC
jgi:hypothetical protein